MRQKTDPVNILIAVIAIMVLASIYLLTHRIYQTVVPTAPPGEIPTQPATPPPAPTS